MAITGFFHGGVPVRDMDRSLRFYRDGLGLEIEFDRMLDAATSRPSWAPVVVREHPSR